jgi:hypothetical protein
MEVVLSISLRENRCPLGYLLAFPPSASDEVSSRQEQAEMKAPRVPLHFRWPKIESAAGSRPHAGGVYLAFQNKIWTEETRS